MTHIYQDVSADSRPLHRTNPYLPAAVHSLAWLLASCWLILFFASSAAAQNLQYTDNKADLSLRSELKVDPSTLGMSVQIPLRLYAGRGSTSIPITLYYSSKVWRIEYVRYVDENDPNFDVAVSYTATTGIYSDKSASGWTSSVSYPTIDWDDNRYDSDGRPCAACQNNPNLAYYIARLHVKMPDGSAHELRKSDAAAPASSNSYTGTYYAVDSSRLRYVAASQTAGTLYLPDGSRYELNVDGIAQRFIDRNGNTIDNWTDTLNRSINGPPLDNSAAIDRSYHLPGVDGTTLEYIFRWRHLAEVLTPDPVTDLVPPLHHIGDKLDFIHLGSIAERIC